jgi:hypothetical protein
VIQVLGGGGAILTTPAIATEHRSTCQRGMRPIWHTDVPSEPNDRRRLHDDPLGVEDHAVGKDDLGLLLEHQDHRPARRNDRQGRVRRVEDERTSHGTSVTANTAVADVGVEVRTTTARHLNHNGVICSMRRRIGRARCLELRIGAARGVRGCDRSVVFIRISS